MMLISAFMVTGCSKDNDKDTETVAVKEITLSKSTLTLLEGGSETLIATISPAEVENKSIKWTSSNEAVATVSSSGEVKAVALGTATITATTVNGNKTATCTVTVTATPSAITGVQLNKTALSLSVGEKETLTATVTPTNVTNKNVTWSSNNTPVATVSANGEVTAVAAGTATIIVTTVDGGKTATCAVTVVEKIVPVEGVSLNKTALELTMGNSEVLTATIAPATATNKSLTWESDKPAVATVDIAGRVTAVAVGSATITVTADGGKTAKCVVTVPAPVVTSKVRINDGAEQTFTTGKLSEKLTGTVTKIVFSEAEINGRDRKSTRLNSSH